MIWRLTYCNKEGVEARIDIIKGNRTPVEIVQGSGQPFTLSYKLDKNDKSGHIMTSSADIEIFETETFNIDDLKTSNETELKVEYFEDNILTWSGFILPDFFSREIGSPSIVRMTASDRLTALKGITLSDLPSRVSLRNLIELSLAQTGLSLGLASQIQISQGSTNILDSEILSQRLTDVRGRSVNCYDILMSIMVATNSTIRQRKGQWQVYNKLEHELRAPTIFFDKVERGAIRTIQPVASSVGVYNEFGGNRLHPNNYDFSLGLANWTSRNGFEAYIDNKVVWFFLGGAPFYHPDVTTKDYLVNYNDWITNETNLDTAPFLESNNIPISSTQDNTVEVEVDISAVMAEKLPNHRVISFLRYAIIATNGTKTYALNKSGVFEVYNPEKIEEHSIVLAGGQQEPLILATPPLSKSEKRKGLLEVNNVNDFHVNIRIYGSSFDQYVNVEFVSVKFDNKTETPKGNLYKTTQGSNFTKLHDIETVIFGDYIRSGLNGYFYNYPIDDTSNLYLPSGELSPPEWETIFDTTERPLLHHISRQKSRLFSVAHDILKANINVESFDPLAVFQDCKGGKYVIVSAIFDFLRSEVDVELEQIAYDNTILKRDFIYSYFGEGEDTIKSIGGIAGGGGGTGGGGGMTSEQLEMLTNLADWWKLDEENDAIYSEKSVYSLKGVSALGLGSEGSGSGGGVDMLDSWANYTPDKADYYAPASLLVPFRNDTLSRLASLEAGGGASNIEIATTGSGNAVTGVSKSGNTLTFAKSSTFALSSHTHTIANVTGLQSALNDKQNTLIAGANITISGNTISSSGGISSVSWGDITGKPSTFVPSAHTHTIANVTGLQSALNDKQNTLIAGANITISGNTISSSGGISSVSWGDITGKPSTFVPSAHTHTIANVTGLQSALNDKQNTLIAGANITISGNTISSSGGISSVSWGDITGKPSTFVPSAHTHTIANVTGLQSALNDKQNTLIAGANITISGNTISSSGGISSVSWGDITGKPSTFVPSAHTHTIANVTGLQTALDGKEPSFAKNTAFNKNFGTTSGTVAQGNDSRIVNGQTAYGWGNHASAGYALSSALSGYVPTTRTITAGNGLTGGGTLSANRTLTLGTPSTLTNDTTNDVTTSSHTHAITTTTVGAINTIVATDASGGVRGNLIRIGGNWTLELDGTELLFKYNNVTKQRMFQDGSFVATGGVAAFSQGVEADTLDLLRLKLNQGGGDSKYLSSTATQVYFDIGGATPLSMAKTEVRRGNTDNNVNLGTSAYPWANIYGVNLIASTHVSTPKITLGNGWTIEQTSSSLTIRKNGVVKGTFNA